jgi:hypothetical protein
MDVELVAGSGGEFLDDLDDGEDDDDDDDLLLAGASDVY